jgi:hypothetical protein
MAKKKVTVRQLSKAEKFYIENNCQSLNIEDICKDIECPVSIASEYYKNCLDKIKKADTIDKLMVVDKKNGYTVMTKGASEKSETTRKKGSNKSLTEHIHRIR